MRQSNLKKNRTWNIELRRKKKERPYSILIQKSKGSNAFDEQKVKNIAIEYRFFSTLVKPHCAMAQTSAVMISQCNVDFLKINKAYLTGLQCSYFGKLFGDL